MNSYEWTMAELRQIAGELDGRDDPGDGVVALSFDRGVRSAGLDGAGTQNDQNLGAIHEHDLMEIHHVQGT